MRGALWQKVSVFSSLKVRGWLGAHCLLRYPIERVTDSDAYRGEVYGLSYPFIG